jgi:transposase-like protein
VGRALVCGVSPISDRQREEMMEERGVKVDHSSLIRWVIRYVPLLDQAFRVRNGRNLCADKWPVDVCVPGRRQDRGHGRFLLTAKRR